MNAPGWQRSQSNDRTVRDDCIQTSATILGIIAVLSIRSCVFRICTANTVSSKLHLQCARQQAASCHFQPRTAKHSLVFQQE